MLREEDKIKAKKVAKMINSQDSKSSGLSPLPITVSLEVWGMVGELCLGFVVLAA